MGLEQGVQAGRAGAFFKSHMQAAAQTVDESEKGVRFGLQDGFHDQLAAGIQHGHGDHCLVHIQPNILGVIHEGAPCR
jgi:hypothetical protein